MSAHDHFPGREKNKVDDSTLNANSTRFWLLEGPTTDGSEATTSSFEVNDQYHPIPTVDGSEAATSRFEVNDPFHFMPIKTKFESPRLLGQSFSNDNILFGEGGVERISPLLLPKEGDVDHGREEGLYRMSPILLTKYDGDVDHLIRKRSAFEATSGRTGSLKRSYSFHSFSSMPNDHISNHQLDNFFFQDEKTFPTREHTCSSNRGASRKSTRSSSYEEKNIQNDWCEGSNREEVLLLNAQMEASRTGFQMLESSSSRSYHDQFSADQREFTEGKHSYSSSLGTSKSKRARSSSNEENNVQHGWCKGSNSARVPPLNVQMESSRASRQIMVESSSSRSDYAQSSADQTEFTKVEHSHLSNLGASKSSRSSVYEENNIQLSWCKRSNSVEVPSLNAQVESFRTGRKIMVESSSSRPYNDQSSVSPYSTTPIIPVPYNDQSSVSPYSTTPIIPVNHHRSSAHNRQGKQVRKGTRFLEPGVASRASNHLHCSSLHHSKTSYNPNSGSPPDNLQSVGQQRHSGSLPDNLQTTGQLREHSQEPPSEESSFIPFPEPRWIWHESSEQITLPPPQSVEVRGSGDRKFNLMYASITMPSEMARNYNVMSLYAATRDAMAKAASLHSDSGEVSNKADGKRDGKDNSKSSTTSMM